MVYWEVLAVENQKHTVSYGKVWTLSWPIIASNILIPLVGAADTAIMGHLPDSIFIAAVALANTVLHFIYGSTSFLRMSVTGLTAQAYGEENNKEIIAHLFRGAIVAIVLSIIIIAFQSSVFGFALQIFNSSQELEAYAQQYFNICVWVVLPILSSFVVMGWLFGIQKPKQVLFLRIFTNVLNVIFSLYFVLGLGWGIQGVATGTLLAEFLGLLASFFIIKPLLDKYLVNVISESSKPTYSPQSNRQREVLLDILRQVFVQRDKLYAVFKVNGDIFVRSLLLMVAFSWFNVAGASQGDSTLAINSILINLIVIAAFSLDGFAQATEMIVGEAVGMKNKKVFDDAIRVSTVFAAAFAALFVVIYVGFSGFIIKMFTSIEEIQEASRSFFLWAALMPLVGVWAYQLDGIFTGAMATKEMRDTMIVSFLVYAFFMLVSVNYLGNHGLWLSLIVFKIARALTMYPKLKNIF